MSSSYTGPVVLGVAMGTLARLYMLRVDYRQYPSYPQGYVIHLTLGLIASFLGAVAPPALLSANFEAATFLALAAAQFRETRKIERETLANMEGSELVPRGAAYIEGIARVFEARNYLAMIVALAATVAALPFLERPWLAAGAGVAAGIAAALVLNQAMSGERVGDIARVRVVGVSFDGALLTVDGVALMNVGRPEERETWLRQGLGVVIEPKDVDAKATLANVGQRQAIAHDAATFLGIRRDVDEPAYVPLVRRDSQTGKVVMGFLAPNPDPEALASAVRNVPVLEQARRRPLKSAPARRVE